MKTAAQLKEAYFKLLNDPNASEHEIEAAYCEWIDQEYEEEEAPDYQDVEFDDTPIDEDAFEEWEHKRRAKWAKSYEY